MDGQIDKYKDVYIDRQIDRLQKNKLIDRFIDG